ncbi:MAG: alanine racemase [Gemmatimonadales bacterium]
MSTHASRRAWVEIDLAALVANARTVEAAAGSRLLPMVKANAYGLGAVAVAHALDALNPWGYGVATVGEGIELRIAGITRPVLVFTPAARDQYHDSEANDLTAVLDDPDVAASWDRPYHLEIDTGMARCGLRWDDDRLAVWPSGHLAGCFTHFHSADTDPDSVRLQAERFEAALARLPTRPPLVHAAGSAAAWRLNERFDLVRPGVFLYGGTHAFDLTPPAPVATLRAPVVSVRRLRAGDTVSYGAAWTAPRDTTIATVAVGYADGVSRAVEGKASVVLDGRRLSVVGRVTMDFIMVDAGDRAVRPGDVATLIGEGITLDEFAGWAGSNTYEVLARLGARLERVYQ